MICLVSFNDRFLAIFYELCLTSFLDPHSGTHTVDVYLGSFSDRLLASIFGLPREFTGTESSLNIIDLFRIIP